MPSVRRVWANGEVVATFTSPFTVEESLHRADSLVGKPFEQLPGKPAQHKIVGALADGSKVRVVDVETVYNDWTLFSFIDGEGTYEESYRNRSNGARQLEVLELAKRLFAAGVN